tara:strand:- start:14108 stop:14752 length:645 start_codon:yes stop_codon:yes gene_type:complete
MNSRNSLISKNPFIIDFVEKIIRSIGEKKGYGIQKSQIYIDLVPKFSDNIIKSSLEKENVFNKDQSKIKDIKSTKKFIPQRNLLIPKKIVRPISQEGQFNLPQQPEGDSKEKVGDYGKLEPLLNDPSISLIECPGQNKPLGIIRVGRRQLTKISLTEKEINDILSKISEESHIPLLGGVFRAAVRNFSINAVVSETIEKKFIIKKQIAQEMIRR